MNVRAEHGRAPAPSPAVASVWAEGAPSRVILDSVHDAFISIDEAGRVSAWNLAAQRTFGWSADEALGRLLAELIIPERYRAAHRAGLERLARTGEARTQDRRVELEALHRDGHEFPVELMISRADVGDAVVFSAFVRDISERRRAERDLREARERFQSAFEHAPIGMALVAPDGRFLEVNAALCGFYARSEPELLALGLPAVTHPDDLAETTALVQEARRGESEDLAIEKRYLRPDGSVAWGSAAISVIRDVDGAPLHLVVQIQDISERKQAEQELARYAEQLNELALTDPLTGLRNYRDFHAALEREIARARRHGGTFSLALIDLDDFGRVNDTRGHSAGDRVLQAVADAIAGCARASDLVARIGGDEFGLLLPESDTEGARAFLRRARQAVEDLADGISLSGGVATWPSDGETKELLLQYADTALYAAKPGAGEGRGAGRGLSARAAERVNGVLAHAREQLDLQLTFLGEFRDGAEVLVAVDGDGQSFGVREGSEAALGDTYCQRLVDGRIPHIVADARTHPSLADLPATREADIGAYIGVPLTLSDGRLYGALCGLSHEPRPDLSAHELAAMRFLAGVVADILEAEAAEARDRQGEVELSGVNALVAALEARDLYTGEHSKTVVELATRVAASLDLTEAQVAEVAQVAVLHDIGKVGIPDSILQKRGPLDEQEWELMRQHPAVGERIVASIESLAHLAPAVRAEHERYDGTGYPDNLRGSDIPIASRITLACDAYDAMTSDRPYRAALAPAKARQELQQNAGTQFDPKVVEALLNILAGPTPAVSNGRHAQPARR